MQQTEENISRILLAEIAEAGLANRFKVISLEKNYHAVGFSVQVEDIKHKRGVQFVISDGIDAAIHDSCRKHISYWLEKHP